MLAQKNKKEHTIVIQTGNRLDEIKVTIVTYISNLGQTVAVGTKLTQRLLELKSSRLTTALVMNYYFGSNSGTSSLLQWSLS